MFLQMKRTSTSMNLAGKLHAEYTRHIGEGRYSWLGQDTCWKYAPPLRVVTEVTCEVPAVPSKQRERTHNDPLLSLKCFLCTVTCCIGNCLRAAARTDSVIVEGNKISRGE
jgi:hypothetical protein